MKKSLIVNILLTIVLVTAGLTACTTQKYPDEGNSKTPTDSGSVSQDYQHQITNEIASLVTLDFLGLKYSDNVTNEFVLKFIYHLAMQSYFDRAKVYDGAVFDKTFQYVAFTKDELADILNLAFGEQFSTANLTINPAETRNIIYDSDMYYVSIGETVLINIEYLSNHDENTAVYSYKVESSTTIANGEVTVEVVSSSGNTIGVSVANMLVDERSRVSDEDYTPDITDITSLTLDNNGENDDAVRLIQHIPEGKIYADIVEVVITLGDGRVLTKSYEGFWFSSIHHAELLGNGQHEIVLNLYYFGSNYGAADCHVLKVADGELVEILTILDNNAINPDADIYRDTLFEVPAHENNFGLDEDGRTVICTGASIINFDGKAALKIQHLIKEVVPYTILVWDGLNWTVAEQGVDLLSS